MAVKPTVVELKQRIRDLEEEVAENRQAQLALCQRDEKYRSILNSIEDGYYEVDLAGNLTFFNDSLCQIYGIPRDELMGMNNRDYTSPETARKVYQVFSEVYTTGKSARIFDWEFIRKDGSRIYVEISVSLIRNSDGGPIGFRGIVRDVTARRRAEEELRRSEDKYREIIESIQEGYYEVNLKGTYTFVNHAMSHFRGFSKEELIGMNNREYMDEETAKTVYKIFNEVYRTGKPSKGSWGIYDSSGGKRHGESSILLMKDSEGKPVGFRGLVRDVTDRIRAEEELKQAKAKAEAANVAKSAFLANMSHEIRTPLNGVVGFTDMLLETRLDEEQSDYARTIKRSGQALLSLLNDILDFSKIEAGELDFEEIDFDPELLVYDVCDVIRPRIGKKPVEILYHIADDLPAQVKGDPFRVRQVLTNLMGNAAKFTESGEIELSFTIEEETDNRAKFHARVRDTGIGIPEEKLNTIFEAFHQADSSTTRKYGGSGLGLSICKQISSLMEGDVWAESGVGKGSVFHFTGWLGKAADKAGKRFAPVSLRGMKVLIVDDNQTGLDILSHILELAHMRVVALSNPGEVLPALKDAVGAGDPFRVFLSDIHMPGMSGYTLAEQIRDPKHRIPPLPMLALSSSMERDARKCKESGFEGFLTKPIYRERLFHMMERILGERKEEGVETEKIMTQYSVREDMKRSVSILLVEDNAVNQKLASALLTKAGYKVEVAGDGRAAVDRFVSSPDDFDLIFMDVQMPVMDGMEATAAIRKMGFDTIPIIAMTAAAMEGDRQKCLEAGMNDYIPKPFKRELVFERIEKWVLGRKSL